MGSAGLELKPIKHLKKKKKKKKKKCSNKMDLKFKFRTSVERSQLMHHSFR